VREVNCLVFILHKTSPTTVLAAEFCVFVVFADLCKRGYIFVCTQHFSKTQRKNYSVFSTSLLCKHTPKWIYYQLSQCFPTLFFVAPLSGLPYLSGVPQKTRMGNTDLDEWLNWGVLQFNLCYRIIKWMWIGCSWNNFSIEFILASMTFDCRLTLHCILCVCGRNDQWLYCILCSLIF